MDSLHIYKGYGHLNHLEDQDLSKNPQFPSRKNPLAIIFLILLTLIIGSVIGALIYHSQTEPPEEEEEEAVTRSIRFVCNVTRYPDSCFSSLSSIITESKPDPEFLFSLSLQAAMRELNKLASLPESLSSRVEDSRTRSALKDCQNLFSDALDRLNQSALAAKEHVASYPAATINDINTWISAAMTDQETCLDGLKEIGSTVVDVVRAKVQGSKVCMSNSLAILVNIKSLVDKFRFKG